MSLSTGLHWLLVGGGGWSMLTHGPSTPLLLRLPHDLLLTLMTMELNGRWESLLSQALLIEQMFRAANWLLLQASFTPDLVPKAFLLQLKILNLWLWLLLGFFLTGKFFLQLLMRVLLTLLLHY